MDQVSLPADDIASAEARLEGLRADHGEAEAFELLRAMIVDEFPGRIALVSSFGGESVVLLHMISHIDRATPVLFLDTGFLFPETIDYQRELKFLLGLTDVRILRPNASHEEDLDPHRDLHQSHPNVCCFFRKVVPLRNALKPFSAWISGRKRYQGGERADLAALERDGRHIKANPLATWSPGDVNDYIRRHALPQHPLVSEGYLSIGCEPCTTPVRPGEDFRAGRWRGSDVNECGIHFIDGRAVRGTA